MYLHQFKNLYLKYLTVYFVFNKIFYSCKPYFKIFYRYRMRYSYIALTTAHQTLSSTTAVFFLPVKALYRILLMSCRIFLLTEIRKPPNEFKTFQCPSVQMHSANISFFDYTPQPFSLLLHQQLRIASTAANWLFVGMRAR